MKILCVYNPSLMLIPSRQGMLLSDAVVAFSEHSAAQDFFGFKVALSELAELALATANQTVLASAEIILNSILQRLTNSRGDFCFVPDLPQISFEAQQGASLFASYLDQETVGIWQDLIGSCLETGLRVCYASWSAGNDPGDQVAFTDHSGRHLDIARNRLEWGEAYRQLRKHPANLLPNAFIPPSVDDVIFAFCPPEGLLEDEQDLPRERLPRGMIDQGKWREIGGNQRGYRDRWGNFWMWNQNRGHWDVQITEQTKRAVDAFDWHLNVQCAGEIAASDNTCLEGRIVEGFQPVPSAMFSFSIWD